MVLVLALLFLPCLLIFLSIFRPICLAIDAYHLAQAIILAIVAAARLACSWSRGRPALDSQVAKLLLSDLRCITWILQTLLEKDTHLLTLKLLTTMTTVANLNPTIISTWFDVLSGYTSIVGGRVVIKQGSENLAAESALCCLRALSHPITTDSTSSVFKDAKQRYIKAFPSTTDFEAFPHSHRFRMIHATFHQSQGRKIQWNCGLSSDERAAIIQFAWSEYWRNGSRKMPRWILRFALHRLSQDPLPPTPVVIDCLSIIVVDLGCTVARTTTLHERCAHI